VFIRQKKLKYKDKTYTNYQLVESVHTPKGPRQRVVCSLGNLKPRPKADWLKLAHKIESALMGQMDLLEKDDQEVLDIVGKIKVRDKKGSTRSGPVPEEPRQKDDLVAIQVDGVSTELHREAGSVHVGYQYWKRLGLDEILCEVGLDERSRTLTCLMTMNRLFAPSSENAMPDWIRSTALGDILGLDLERLGKDSLYRNLDHLHPLREKIEASLAERERTLFNLDQTVFLYDLTSTYFEGAASEISKAKLGYSRDKRPDCKQVLVGLVVNRDGFPLAHEVFEGNSRDHKTLSDMLDQLGKRVSLKGGGTVVVDRGMAFDENLQQIKDRGLRYLVASRQKERDQWLAEFEDSQGFADIEFTPSPTNPFQKKSPVKVKMKRTDTETHVLCLSAGRKEKDRAIRVKQEKRLLADLEKLEKRVANGRLVKPEKIGEAIGRLKERYPRVARYYRIEYDAQTKSFSHELNAAKRSVAESLDGSYMLKTDRKDLSAEDSWRIYTLLTRAEEAFRTMKSPLAERPIFHHLERRVETHIFLCLLAFHLLVAVEKTLRDKGLHTSFKTVREQLKTHQICTTVLPTKDGDVLKIRKASTPERQHKELYKLLDVPEQIIRPQKTWIRSKRDVI
jgi:transposase